MNKAKSMENCLKSLSALRLSQGSRIW